MFTEYRATCCLIFGSADQLESRLPVCQLCREERKLIDAHILPRAFWRLSKPSERPAKIISDSEHPKVTRKGVYDQTILCRDCDNLIGTLDGHAVKALLKSEPISAARLGRSVLGKCYPRADATELTKFVASVAWRASISKQRFFHRVKLGPYEEPIRQWILTGGERPRGIEATLAEFDRYEVPILDPHQTKTEGVRYWVIYGDRFVFYLKTDQRPTPISLRPLALTDGQPVISVVRSWLTSKEFTIQRKLAYKNRGAFE